MTLPGPWQGRDEPRLGLTVDDVLAMVPAEQLVMLKTAAGRIWLTDQDSRTRYRELTADMTPDAAPFGLQPKASADEAQECRSPRHEAASEALGEWMACQGCQRRYRPASPRGSCYDCTRGRPPQ